MLLLEMFDKYIEHVTLYNASGTLEFVQSHTSSILKQLGNIDPSIMTKSDWFTYIHASQSFGLTNNTINKRIGLIKRVCRFHEIKDIPLFEIKKLKEQFVTFGFLDDKKVTKLAQAIDQMSIRDKLIFYIFMDTGCRLTELTKIEVKNIDFETRSIFLSHTKTNKVRYVYFTSETSKLLKKFLKKHDHEYLFTTYIKNEPMRKNTIELIFSRIKKKYQIEKLSPHMLRHTLSTQLYHSGADLILISEILGHSSTDTTKRYIHSDLKSNLTRYDKFKKRL